MEPTSTPTLPADSPVSPAVLETLAARERLQCIVEECAGELEAVVPGLHLRRAFAGGAWVVGVATGGQWGDGRPFSRLEFHMRFAAAEGRVTLTSFATVRNRDIGRDEQILEVSPRGTVRARRFIEDGFCRFVDRWFERDGEEGSR